LSWAATVAPAKALWHAELAGTDVRTLKEHAWKLIPLSRADAHGNPPTHSRPATSRNIDMHRRVPVNDGVCPGFRGACDTVLTQKQFSLRGREYRFVLVPFSAYVEHAGINRFAGAGSFARCGCDEWAIDAEHRAACDSCRRNREAHVVRVQQHFQNSHMRSTGAGVISRMGLVRSASANSGTVGPDHLRTQLELSGSVRLSQRSPELCRRRSLR
jgi:hypothetical protein